MDNLLDLPTLFNLPTSQSEPADEQGFPRKAPRRPARPLASMAHVERGLAASGIFRMVDTRDRHDEGVSIQEDDEDAFHTATAIKPTRGLEVRVTVGGCRYLITSTYQLGSTDLAIFLAILGEAGLLAFRRKDPARAKAAKDASRAPERYLQLISEDPAAVAESLQATGHARLGLPRETLVTTAHSLLIDAGLPTGQKEYNLVRDALRRLSRVRYTVLAVRGANSPVETDGENLLWYQIKKDPSQVVIRLGHEITQFLLSTGGYAFVDMNEVRELRGAGRILYMQLCAHVREGASETFDLPTLAAMIYGPPVAHRSKSAMQTRLTQKAASTQRSRAKSVLLKLASVLPAWKVELVPGKTKDIPHLYGVRRLTKADAAAEAAAARKA